MLDIPASKQAMLYFAILLIIPAVTSHDSTYDCLCNSGNRPLVVITGSYQYMGHNPAIQVDTTHGYPSLDHDHSIDSSVKFNALQNSRFVKGLLPRLFPGRCLRRHLGYKDARADLFPVAVLGQVGYIYNNQGVDIYSTVCDASTGNPIRRTTPTPMTTPPSMYTPLPIDGPHSVYRTTHSLSETESRRQRTIFTCILQICIDCYCKLGKFAQVINGLVVGKRTICLMCNVCTITCNKTAAGTNAAAQVLPPAQIALTAQPPQALTIPALGPATAGGCTDSVDSCAIHSRSICAAFADWSRQNCAKFCDMCPTSGYLKPTTGHWLSFGNP